MAEIWCSHIVLYSGMRRRVVWYMCWHLLNNHVRFIKKEVEFRRQSCLRRQLSFQGDSNLKIHICFTYERILLKRSRNRIVSDVPRLRTKWSGVQIRLWASGLSVPRTGSEALLVSHSRNNGVDSEENKSVGVWLTSLTTYGVPRLEMRIAIITLPMRMRFHEVYTENFAHNLSAKYL